MEQNIIEYQKNTRVSIPANLLDQRSENIRCQVNVLKSVDYTPFIKKNMFKNASKVLYENRTRYY